MKLCRAGLHQLAPGNSDTAVRPNGRLLCRPCKRTRDQAYTRPPNPRSCSVTGCEAEHKGRGLCSTHLTRLRRRGTTALPTTSTTSRFWSHVEKTDGCWLWQGALRRGYGAFSLAHSKMVTAHRFAYEITVGPIPSGLQLDHVRARGCTSTACVNPAHLEPVTPRTNTARGSSLVATNIALTHCRRGHEFTTENTYVTRRGSRQCRSCARLRARRDAA